MHISCEIDNLLAVHLTRLLGLGANNEFVHFPQLFSVHIICDFISFYFMFLHTINATGIGIINIQTLNSIPGLDAL